ncbi:MAG TPA: hypothetical protein VLG46_16780 [Anaerolineae bacterium]|nr:hypothetical protein [Anaerolineae bacterium]
MLWEDTLPPRRKRKRLTFSTARRDRQATLDEEAKPDFARARQSQPRPVTKRTLHNLVKFWQSVNDDYLEILETEPAGHWDTHVLKSR